MIPSFRLPLALTALLLGSFPAWGQGFNLPPGPGKELVETGCGGCHVINRLGAGYTAEGWRSIVHMMQNMEVPIPPEQWPIVTEYLIKAFPEKPKPAAAIVTGPVQASIREWPVPTPGSRPHDPWASRDGAIWYSGQTANVLGRVEPNTGQVKEYKLKTPHTGPHGITEDGSGNIWFTGNNAALIGKLDPQTGEITEYPMPDPAVRDPHTLTFDQGGILWFTAQQGNRVGRLDPKNGEIKLVTAPTPNSRPYGIQVDSKGVPYFVEFGTNKIGRIDPATLAIREFTLPDPGARPRRLAIAPNDTVWYTDFARGFLGRLDPATGSVKEWPSPSGARSEPYGIVFTKGALWYSESNAKPNTIVRFDPQTEKFQSWAIPGGGDIVRNMAVTRGGDPVMANSLVNAVGLVAVGE
jgi:virginiamycin B lyase